MSNGRPFHLSSFLPGSDDLVHSTNNNPQPQPHHRGDSTNRADSSDEEEAVEVFYDHDAELMGHEITGQATRHHTHQNSNEDVKAVVAGAPRRGTEASTTAAAMEMSLVLQQQQTRTSNRSKRATVRQYNCLVNSAVATMDSAVRVPSALRGAARRTMYDVLVDVQRGTRSEEESSTRVLPVSATAQPSALPPPQQLQKQVPVASAASSTRERTHQMLFPSSIPAQLKKQRGSGGSEGDPIVVHSGGTTTSINTSVASPSSHNLPSTNSNANDSSSQRAALKTPAASSRVKAKTTAASSSAEVERPPWQSTGGEKQKLPACAASLGAGSGPDRRLRHLLPMHLRGAFPDDTPNNHLDDSSRCQDRQRAAQHDAHNSVSDISTSSASSDDERGGGKQTARRATTKAGVPKKDACLLGVLEGGGGRAGGTEPAKVDPLSPHLLLNMKKRTGQDSSTVGEVGWLRRLEEEEYAALQRRQGKSATDSLRGATTGAESSLLEGVLLGIAAHRTSASDRQRASHQKSQRASRSPSSGNTRGSADTGSTRSSSFSSSSSATSAVASADSLDLMRDVDDDVPRWVRRNEARQHPRCHVPFTACQQPPPAGKTSVHLEREYADSVRPFIGKPTAFYPSCAAARRLLREGNATVPSFFAAAAGSAAINSSSGAPPHTHRLNAGRPYSNNSAVGTGRGGFFAFATRVTTAAFFTTWKEGRRLLKQNPTALAVVKYLCERFERWRPFDASLCGDADTACDAGDSSRRRVSSQVKASSEKGDEEEKASARHHPNSPAVALSGDRSDESGVEVKIFVLYVEAAFNVAVVRGTVVWCSEKAHARLGTEERKPADSPLHEQQQQQHQPQCLSDLSCVGFPFAAGAGDGKEVAWSFLFPEPALMQVIVTVGEHLYLAQPYFVYPAQRLVVASYNFTTDAVVRQQRQQFELEAEERLRVVARTANGGRDSVGDADALDTRTGQGVRHRGVSPARTAAHALLSASQAARSPTDLHQTTSTTDRSPHQRVYEIPGGTRTPLRTPLGPALATPDRPRSTPQTFGASPEPLPPSQQLQQGVGQAAKALFTEGHRSVGDTGPGADRTDMRTTLSQTASMTRAGADTVNNATRSVTSFAADGFYDPLAMPAFATTNQTSGGGDGAAAAAAASRFDGGVTMVLTGTSADEEGQPSAMWAGTPAALHDSDGGGIGVCGLCVPPPMQHLAGSPTSHVTYPQGTSDTGSAVGVGVRGDDANAAAVERGTTVRTFGSAEAAVADKMGEGFPRGPPADWDVPLEVIYALSGVVSPRASRSLQLLPPEKSAHTRGGEDQRLNYSSQQQQLLGEPAVAATSSQQRKRARRSVSIESLSPPQPTTAATNAQTSDVQHHQMHNDLTHEVSYSFPTPAVSHAALSPLPHSADADDASLSFSISSPSHDDSDVDITKATTISTEARKDSVLHHRPAARAVPTRGRRGGGIQQQQQQQRQDEWMRRLWQQEPADALCAVAIPAKKSGATTGRAPQEPMGRVTSTPQRSSGGGGGEGEGVRMSFAASGCGATSQQNASVHASATTTTSLSPRASNREVMVAPPPSVEDDTASNTMTGLYALNDVILSDSDD